MMIATGRITGTMTAEWLDKVVLEAMRKEAVRREEIALDFLQSGAFVRDLSTVEVVNKPESWRFV